LADLRPGAITHRTNAVQAIEKVVDDEPIALLEFPNLLPSVVIGVFKNSEDDACWVLWKKLSTMGAFSKAIVVPTNDCRCQPSASL
jgi:hypothetical protein